MKQLNAGTQYLSFVIGPDEYALEILETREVLQYPTVTAVPSMSASIRGVISLRGTAVPIVDLAVVFGQGVQPITNRTCVVVVATGEGNLVGLVVESVHQVFELRAGDIEPPPSLGHRGRRKFIRGLGRVGEGFVLLLDLPRVIEHIDLDESLQDLPLPEDNEPAAETSVTSEQPIDDAWSEHEQVSIEHHESDQPQPEEKEPPQP